MGERVVTERADKRRAFVVGAIAAVVYVVLAAPLVGIVLSALPPGPGADVAAPVVAGVLLVAGVAVLWVKAGRWALLGAVAAVAAAYVVVLLLVGLCALAFA